MGTRKQEKGLGLVCSGNVPEQFSEPILTLFSAFLTGRYAALRGRFWY